MKQIDNFPKSATSRVLRIRHLIKEATAFKEGVVGEIDGVDVTAWPYDDIETVSEWLNDYLYATTRKQ